MAVILKIQRKLSIIISDNIIKLISLSIGSGSVTDINKEMELVRHFQILNLSVMFTFAKLPLRKT